MEKENLKEMKVRKTFWSKQGKWYKAKFIISIIIIVASIFFLFTLGFAREFYGDEFADALYGEFIPNGFIALWHAIMNSGRSILLSLFIVVVAILLHFIVKFIITLITMNKNKRVVTVGSILKSIFKYVIIIAAIAFLLTLWGVNVAGVVASIGIITLIIGLGCQSLINDVISGVFIVFDDYFSVGDMVIIDGFRGYIIEIGLRCVKLDDTCGNIKAINNSAIESVINLSRQTNFIIVTLGASFNENVERCEAVFAKELPEIAKRLPQIVEGPWYKGIDNFDKGGIGFAFAFRVKAEYRFQATRDFKRELYQMYLRNNIIVAYEQLTINQPDPKDRPQPTEEEIKLSKEYNSLNRQVQNGKKNLKIKTKIAKAYKDTMDDSSGH